MESLGSAEKIMILKKCDGDSLLKMKLINHEFYSLINQNHLLMQKIKIKLVEGEFHEENIRRICADTKNCLVKKVHIIFKCGTKSRQLVANAQELIMGNSDICELKLISQDKEAWWLWEKVRNHLPNLGSVHINFSENDDWDIRYHNLVTVDQFKFEMDNLLNRKTYV